MTSVDMAPSAAATLVAIAGLTEGLKALSDSPVRSAFAQMVGGVSQLGGPFASLEAGFHPLRPLTLYANAGWQRALGWNAGGGIRVEFP